MKGFSLIIISLCIDRFCKCNSVFGFKSWFVVPGLHHSSFALVLSSLVLVPVSLVNVHQFRSFIWDFIRRQKKKRKKDGERKRRETGKKTEK